MLQTPRLSSAVIVNPPLTVIWAKCYMILAHRTRWNPASRYLAFLKAIQKRDRTAESAKTDQRGSAAGRLVQKLSCAKSRPLSPDGQSYQHVSELLGTAQPQFQKQQDLAGRRARSLEQSPNNVMLLLGLGHSGVFPWLQSPFQIYHASLTQLLWISV